MRFFHKPPMDRRTLEALIDARFHELKLMVMKMAKIDDLMTDIAVATAEAKDRAVELAAVKDALTLANQEIATLKAAPVVLPVDAASADQVQAAIDATTALKAALAPVAP